MSTDLFGRPLPAPAIRGAQGYLLDTRRTDAPTGESGKLAALRAASIKDPPALLPDQWKLLASGPTLHYMFTAIEEYYAVSSDKEVHLNTTHGAIFTVQIGEKHIENVRVIKSSGRYRFELKS